MEKENVLKTNIVTEESEFKKNSIRILKGSSFAIMMSIILLTIFALLLSYTQISENTITPVVITVVGISILLGSTIATRKIKKNGLLNGGLVGFIYIAILYIASSLCRVRFFSKYVFTNHVSNWNHNRNDRWNYRSKFCKIGTKEKTFLFFKVFKRNS